MKLNIDLISLTFSDCTEQSLVGINVTYHCGYGAHVILGGTYQVDDIGDEDAYFELHDLRPHDDEDTAEIELNLCVGENCKTCSLLKQKRKWVTFDGVDERAEQNDCGQVYNSLRDLVIPIDI